MAHKNVFETSKLKIKVKLRLRSQKDNDKAKLVFVVDGADQAEIELDVHKQWVEHPHEFALVPNAKDNYEWAYRIEHDAETHASDTYTVWPLTAQVKLINDANGAALPDADFDLVFSNDVTSHFRTGNNGIKLCKLKEKALFRTADLPQMVFVRWEAGKEHGRDREARMRLVTFKAALSSPTWAGANRTQVVNLKSGSRGPLVGHDGRGPEIRFDVKLLDAATNNAPLRPKRDEDIFVKATLTDVTRRNARKATLSDVRDLDTSAPNVLKGRLKSGDDGKAQFTLKLGVGGKEKCKLQIGTTNACADVEVNFENTRKIWVQVMAPAGRAPALGDATAALAQVGVTLARDPDVVLTPANLPPYAMVAGADLGQATDQLVVGDHNIKHFDGLFDTDNAPLSAFCVFADYQFDAGKKPLTRDVAYDIANNQGVPFRGGALVHGFQCEPVNGGDSETVLPNSLHNGSPAVRGTWRSTSRSGPTAGLRGDIPADRIHIDWATEANRNKVQVWLPDAAVQAAATDPVEVRLKVTYVLGYYLGWAPKGGVVIAQMARQPRTAADMNATVVHELGHLLNLVAAPRKGVDLTLSDDHEWHYEFRGHSGGHCAFGVDAGVYDGGGTLRGQNTNRCVMFGEGSRVMDFCVKCQPFVLADAVEKL